MFGHCWSTPDEVYRFWNVSTESNTNIFLYHNNTGHVTVSTPGTYLIHAQVSVICEIEWDTEKFKKKNFRDNYRKKRKVRKRCIVGQ